MAKRIKNATLHQIVDSMSDELDSAWALIDEQARMLKHGELGELVDMVGAQKDQNAELMSEIENLAHNDKVNRDVIAKQASKLSDLGHGGAEDLGVAEKFLDKARQNPLRVGMKLMFTPIKTGIIKEHGRAEPQAWTTQRLFGDLCVTGYRQLKWNQGQLATTKAKIRELGVDPETGAINDTSTEIPRNRIQFFEERAAWEADVVSYWDDMLRTAKNLFAEQTGDAWQVPDWLTKTRDAKPVGKKGVSGAEVVAALKADLKADVADLI